MGIGLGAPLGVCVCALVGGGLLIGCRRRRQRTSVGGGDAGGGSDEDVGDGGDKMVRDSGDGGGLGDVAELHGTGVQGCENELEAGFPMVQPRTLDS